VQRLSHIMRSVNRRTIYYLLIVVLSLILSIVFGAISLYTSNSLYLLVSAVFCIFAIAIAFLPRKQTRTIGLETKAPSAVRIVAIDDEADILRLIQIKLAKEGFDVKTASDGEEGIKAVLTVLPEVIIVDVMMPGKDGYQVISEIKKKLGEKAPVAIMLTSKAEEADMVKGLSAGADDYITKPFSPRELIERINVALIKGSKSPT
jgi:CheY-like chemotaxis protein